MSRQLPRGCMDSDFQIGKDTQTTSRYPASPLDILSEISTLPQEKWAPQGEILLRRRCRRLSRLGWERWGEENEMDERSPCRMGFCQWSLSLTSRRRSAQAPGPRLEHLDLVY